MVMRPRPAQIRLRRVRRVAAIGAIALLSVACGSTPIADDSAQAGQPDETGAREVGSPDVVRDDGNPAPDPDDVGDSAAAADDQSPVDTGPVDDGPAEEPPAAGENSDEDDDGAASEPPAGDGPTEEGVGDPEFEARLDELIAFVEEERGHRFVSRPVVDRYMGEDFVDQYAGVLERDVAEHRQDWEEATDVYQALGIIGPSQTLEAILTSFADAGVLGFYDDETERIVLRGGDLDPLVETTLVHELVHALEDQVFDIDRPEYDDRDDEVAWAFSALLEGSATEIEDRFRASLTDAERQAEVVAINELVRGTSMSAFSSSFVDIQFSRYGYGFDLATELWAEGRSALDAALIEPPSTSEQVIHPGLFVSGEAPDVNPAAPAADGEIFSDGVFGEAAWKAILLDAVDRATAERAAAGWGGDWYVAWQAGERTCIRAHVEGDTTEDLDELAAALERWAASGGDRSVFYPTADLIRMTACG